MSWPSVSRDGVAVTARGQELLVVATREALQAPPVKEVVLPPAAEAAGLLLADGGINWGCPCLGGMATGPCGNHFRDAFSCFHYSEADPKGSDCYEKFSVMQECMAQFPELYGKDDDDDLAAALDADGSQQAAGDVTEQAAGDVTKQPAGDVIEHAAASGDGK